MTLHVSWGQQRAGACAFLEDMVQRKVDVGVGAGPFQHKASVIIVVDATTRWRVPATRGDMYVWVGGNVFDGSK